MNSRTYDGGDRVALLVYFCCNIGRNGERSGEGQRKQVKKSVLLSLTKKDTFCAVFPHFYISGIFFYPKKMYVLQVKLTCKK